MTMQLIRRSLAVAIAAAALAGCPAPGTPPPASEYDEGFDDGFLRDDWYWTGFFDSFDSLEYEDVYYQGSDIPFYDDDSYDAGFYDGVWYAYNDGYFTDYRYAFILGFSEGYDAAYYPDYLSFLDNDIHVENANGGWGDGYNDGFSEGRIFGAADYEEGRAFDWLDALVDYESGTDLYFEEIDLGTGVYGPVFLYEYGVDPLTLKNLAADRGERPGGMPAIRDGGLKSAKQEGSIYRPIRADAAAELDVNVKEIERSARDLRYDDTRLDRLTDYLNAVDAKAAGDAPRARRAAPAE